MSRIMFLLSSNQKSYMVYIYFIYTKYKYIEKRR